VPAVPFTPAERAKIRMYLGWSEKYRDYDTRLESEMDGVGNDVSADTGAAFNVRDILSKLQNVVDLLESGTGNQTIRAVKGGTVFQGPEEMKTYRTHGRTLVQRMAIIFNVAPRRDFFGDEASTGGIIQRG
jgi:hypothetical protein